MFESLRKRFDSFIRRTEEQCEESHPQKKITATSRVKSLVSGKVRLTESDLDNLLWDLQIDLMQSDVAAETAERIGRMLKEKLVDSEVETGKLDSFLKDTLRGILADILLSGGSVDIVQTIRNSEKPYLILFLGVNGTGKTTTMAKFARYLMDNGFSVVLAAGDTFRAGAIEQIKRHADALGIKVISHERGADSAAVVFDAVAHARARGVDVVLADSAGRMQTNVNLMDELRKIVRVNKPNLKVFVGDALTGNDALEQARQFNEMVGVDGIILSKMDADAKGGSAISITSEIRKPILFVGIGQSYSDLKAFDAEWFARNVV
ncbi:MAG: signal recognition particle-docking protein FtsY [Candidatus Altiarchaeota archaeon]